MPQNPLQTLVARATNTNLPAPLLVDAQGGLIVSDLSGTGTALNMIAAAVVKATPGKAIKAIVIAGGTAANGNFVLNDCATVGAAAAANVILSIPSGTTAGTIYSLDVPCATGIVLSAVPSLGSPILAVVYA